MTNYRMPVHLSDFQRDMYIHLIDWKRRHLTDKSGHYAGHSYDAVLPEELKGKLPHLYKPIHQRFLDHQRTFHFKTHKFADHMASSQVACANLFLPIMVHPTTAPTILREKGSVRTYVQKSFQPGKPRKDQCQTSGRARAQAARAAPPAG